MTRTILADVSGFTPIIDDLAAKYGLIRAAVFGRIWRFCQMEDGVCRASLDKLSEGLGVDRATIMRHAAALVEDGFLIDTTPDLRNRPHIYADTGKASIRIGVSAGVAQSNATVAECNTGVAQSNATVAESKLKKDSNKDSKKDSKERVTTSDIFQAIEQHLHHKFNGAYAAVNPRLSIDEKPNRITLLVDREQPGLAESITGLVESLTNRRYSINVTVNSQDFRQTDDVLGQLREFHNEVVGATCFLNQFDDEALLFCAREYTPEQYRATYQTLKREPRYKKTAITPQIIAKNISMIGATHAATRQPSPSINYTPDQLAAADAINRQRRAATAGL